MRLWCMRFAMVGLLVVLACESRVGSCPDEGLPCPAYGDVVEKTVCICKVEPGAPSVDAGALATQLVHHAGADGELLCEAFAVEQGRC